MGVPGAPLQAPWLLVAINNPGEKFCLHLLQHGVDKKSLLHMDAYCRYLGIDFFTWHEPLFV